MLDFGLFPIRKQQFILFGAKRTNLVIFFSLFLILKAFMFFLFFFFFL